MKTFVEQENFSQRLQQALQNAKYSTSSPTQLAREFNARYPGRPITVHAARKWLVGEAIPTQEKLRTLANWLGVPAEWLRFGDEFAQDGQSEKTGHFDSEDTRMIADLQRLDEHYRTLAHEILRMLVRVNRRK